MANVPYSLAGPGDGALEWLDSQRRQTCSLVLGTKGVFRARISRRGFSGLRFTAQRRRTTGPKDGAAVRRRTSDSRHREAQSRSDVPDGTRAAIGRAGIFRHEFHRERRFTIVLLDDGNHNREATFPMELVPQLGAL